MDTAAEKIAKKCMEILKVMDGGVFTRFELDLVLSFFKEIVKRTEELLAGIPIPPPPQSKSGEFGGGDFTDHNF